MRAAVCRRYGPPDASPRRAQAGAGRTRSWSGPRGDGRGVDGRPPVPYAGGRPAFPVLGCDFAGQVEAAGPAVTRRR